MQAVVYRRYGSPDVLQIQELPTPQPGDNEILIRTHATTVTAGDWRVRSLTMPLGFGWISRLVFGVLRPRQAILGSELAGEVVARGKNVDQFQIGDQVFAFNGAGMGCHAEYKCMQADGAIALKPANLSFEQAAALSFGGTTALDFFRRGKLQSGDRLLINGAAGGVGTAAIQLARHFGAEVTAVCSGANRALAQSLGAQHVVDYTQQDFTRNGERYDVIMDIAGTAPFSRCQGSLKDNGRLLLVLANLPQMLAIPWQRLGNSKRIVAGPAAERADDLRLLAQLAEQGKYMPVIDRCYPFEQIIEAHRHVDGGHKKGNVVISLSPRSAPGPIC